jgi:hypothetical protein
VGKSVNRESAQVAPWPIEELEERLLAGNALHLLTRQRQNDRTRDVREAGLEGLAEEIMVAKFGRGAVVTRRAIGDTLRVRKAPFPGRALPDIAVRFGGKIHVLELKSSRIDYSRFDNVFDSPVFKEFLRGVGDEGRVPYEVEQDLIKLSLYARLSEDVGSCLFAMVDAYEGPGRSWASVFESPAAFRATMRTQFVQGRADELVGATRVKALEASGVRARLITCVIRPWIQ